MPTFTLTPNPRPRSAEQLAKILENPGFAKQFSDNMVSIDWTSAAGWHGRRVEPYGPIELEPSALVLHYGQEIFEGLKIFRHGDGSLWAFRPEANARRFRASAARLALPELSDEDFLGSLKQWAAVDGRWVPAPPQCVYARPFMFATEGGLGIRPTARARYMLICSPSSAGIVDSLAPAKIWVSTQYTRAAPGGTGAVKCGGNYAASLIAQQEAIKKDCYQVLFLDSTGKMVEELGGMNVMLVVGDHTLITPPLSGTILPGITRDSLLQLARHRGLTVREEEISFDRLCSERAEGKITEIFACGTAASVQPIGELLWEGGRLGDASAPAGPITRMLREELTGIQYGTAPDPYGWMTRLDTPV